VFIAIIARVEHNSALFLHAYVATRMSTMVALVPVVAHAAVWPVVGKARRAYVLKTTIAIARRDQIIASDAKMSSTRVTQLCVAAATFPIHNDKR
jgi:hypothetical protein